MAYSTITYRDSPLYRLTQVVWYLLDIIEILLALRFLFKLLGANPGAVFTHFLYGVTYPLVFPFISVFRISQVAGATFEWTTLLAMVIYWIIAWIIVRLITLGEPIPTQTVDRDVL